MDLETLTGGAHFDSVCVAALNGNSIYIAYAGNEYAYDAGTGKFLWSVNIPTNKFEGSAAVSNGKLFFATASVPGDLYAFAPTTTG